MGQPQGCVQKADGWSCRSGPWGRGQAWADCSERHWQSEQKGRLCEQTGSPEGRKGRSSDKAPTPGADKKEEPSGRRSPKKVAKCHPGDRVSLERAVVHFPWNVLPMGLGDIPEVERPPALPGITL